ICLMNTPECQFCVVPCPFYPVLAASPASNFMHDGAKKWLIPPSPKTATKKNPQRGVPPKHVE
ncbi:MAG: hypothetical protein Q6367_014210, partial [Candidatus Freyarchaeota archaeon]